MFYDIECEDAMWEEVGGDDGDSEGELIIKVRSGISRLPARDPEITQLDHLQMDVVLRMALRQLLACCEGVSSVEMSSGCPKCSVSKGGQRPNCGHPEIFND